jgi:hypothetical protein
MIALLLLLLGDPIVRVGDTITYTRGDVACTRLVLGIDTEADGTQTIHLVDGSYAASDLPSDWVVVGSYPADGPPEVLP